MKKIIITLTAITFALGLAAAAQAQAVKNPEKPEVQSTQVAPKETAKPAAPEAVKPCDPTKEAVKPGDQGKAQKTAKKDTQKASKQVKAEKKPGAPLVTPPEGTK